MSDKVETPNFPDILGTITGGDRINISVVQLAAAVSPRVIRAGRPFKVTLLIQNASDVDLDVTATLKLPERDAKKKKGRFVCKTNRLVVGVGKAEVGYVTLPVTTTPDTATGADYKITADLKVAPRDKTKPSRIRHSEGGGRVKMSDLPKDIVEEIESIKSLNYITEATGLRGTTIEVPFSIIPGKVGTVPDLQPGWKSLWTMKDLVDDSLLLNKYIDVLKEKVLPALDMEKLYTPILEKTTQRFKDVGYPLQEIEAHLVTKLLCLILSYASSSDTLNMATELHNVHQNLKSYQGGEIKLPEWTSAMLHLFNRNEKSISKPLLALTELLYEDLLRDAMRYGFDRIEMALDQELGSDEERDAYVETVMVSFEEDITLDFERAYMPLVIAGITAFDQIVIGNENMDDWLQEMISMLDKREEDATDDAEAIYDMAKQLLDKQLLKYGYDVERMK